MNTEETLKTIFSETFTISKDEITLQTRQNNLEAWSSLGQLRLIMTIEEKMGISFSIDEIAQLDSFEKILGKITKA